MDDYDPIKAPIDLGPIEKAMTGETNGHRHEFTPGQRQTGSGGVGPHTHSITPGATQTGSGGPDNHTHTL